MDQRLIAALKRIVIESELFQDPRQGEEVEVTIKFDRTKLTPEQEEKVFQAGKLLGEVGIGYDSGGSAEEIDWEWDWSLSGPVKVEFRRFVEDNKGSNRYSDPEKDSVDPSGSGTEWLNNELRQMKP